MNDILKDKLRVIASDELMVGAIKAAIEEEIKASSPDIYKTDNNNILGEKYRAAKKAEELMEKVLIKINSYKEQRSSNKIINQGK